MALRDEVEALLKYDPNQLRDRRGRWIPQGTQAGKVRVYHGTADNLWEHIQKEGLLPGNVTGINVWNEPGGERLDYVYLADSEGWAYEWGEYALSKHNGTGLVILTVDVPVDQLANDEGMPGGVGWKFKGTIPPEWIKSHRVVTLAEVKAKYAEQFDED